MVHHNNLIIVILLLSLPFLSNGQTKENPLVSHISSLSPSKEKDLPRLVAKIIAPYTTQEEKFRGIYTWIIHHISYDYKALKNKRINKNNQDILDRKKAICWGYATLLKEMCTHAQITTEIITGYVRTGLNESPFLKYPNHAWNAVQLDDNWYLVDATWDSQSLEAGSEFHRRFGEDYYLTNPKYFITNHLPANPQWQLLSCPISIEDFEQPIDDIVIIAQNKNCAESITPTPDASMNYYEKKLLEAIHVYQFNPTKTNQSELAHIQIEYQDYLSEKAERLQIEQKLDSLLAIQLQMIDLCETASNLTDLYDSQLENCAYNYFNHAVALSQVELTPKNETQNLEKMLYYFESAVEQLQQLPKNIFTTQAIEQSKEYIAYLKERKD